jgi:hypothetical protein
MLIKIGIPNILVNLHLMEKQYKSLKLEHDFDTKLLGTL